MKNRCLRTRLAAAFIMAALLASHSAFAAKQTDEDWKPKVVVRVEGLTCPFCAYGLEKRIKKLSVVQELAIDIKKGAMELFPKEGKHIDLDEVKEAVKNAGFTLKDFIVVFAGKLTEWEGKPAFLVVSTDEENQETRIKYLLKENDQLKQLKASVESPDREVFIAGKAVKETPEKHKDHPYTIVIEKFRVPSEEKR
jgi:mercuric ion binding protein